MTPGTNASREVVSCRIVRISPGPPRMTSWCATSPGKPDRVDRHVAAHAGRCRVRRSGRCVDLRIGVQLDDLRMWERARSLGREAHHQHGAEGEVGRQEARDPLLARERVELVEGGLAEACRPDHAGDTGRERRHRIAVNGGRRGEVHGRVEARRVDHLPDLDAVTSCPATSRAFIRTAPTLPSRPKSRILMPPAPPRRG